MIQNTDHSACIPQTPRISKQFAYLLREHPRPEDKASIWKRIEATVLPVRPRPKCKLIQPRQLRPFPEREQIYLLRRSR